jgi:hypothetical protein
MRKFAVHISIRLQDRPVHLNETCWQPCPNSDVTLFAVCASLGVPGQHTIVKTDEAPYCTGFDALGLLDVAAPIPRFLD